jgi:hypothetical protein
MCSCDCSRYSSNKDSEGVDSPEVAVNGFDPDLADKFVNALDKAIKFGEGNEVIARLLRKRKMCSSHQSPGEEMEHSSRL